MKKLLAFIMLWAACATAFAQHSSILEDWEEEMESHRQDFLYPFAFTNFTYNNNRGAQEGVYGSGWGFEISALYLGVNPWTGGRFTLGLFDMTFDFEYLKPGYNFVPGTDSNFTVSGLAVPDGSVSTKSRFAYMFPLGYVHSFGRSGWSAAVLASPGFGWDKYHNKYVANNISHNERLLVQRGGSYFRLDVKAMVWYDHVGFVARYTFPKGFQGPGFVSAGISFRI